MLAKHDPAAAEPHQWHWPGLSAALHIIGKVFALQLVKVRFAKGNGWPPLMPEMLPVSSGDRPLQLLFR